MNPAVESVCFVSAARQPWGAEHSLASIVVELEALGVPVTVMCRSDRVAAFLAEAGARHIDRISVDGGRFATLLGFARRIRSFTGHGAIVVFSIDLSPLAFLTRAILGRKRPRLVLDLHDAPIRRATRVVHTLFARRFDLVVDISEHVRHSIRGRQEVLIPRPMTPRPARRRQRASTDELHVGVVGRLDPEKRIELAVDAVAACSDLVRLEIFGAVFSDDHYAQGLLDLGKNRLGPRFRHHGLRPPEDIYGAIDVLLVANPDEPSGRTVGEAMMAGIPVVVPDRGGALEFIDPEVSGLAYAGGSSAAAGIAIQSLLDPVRAIELGEAGRRRVLSERNPREVALAYATALGVLALEEMRTA